MTLNDLTGEHVLSGVDFWVQSEGKFADAFVVRFIIDGLTFEAKEDPSDDYRSYLSEIEQCGRTVRNTFAPQKVIGRMKDFKNGYGYEHDTIQFFCDGSGKLVLEIGTDFTNDYYPMAVCHWTPENLAINAEQ